MREKRIRLILQTFAAACVLAATATTTKANSYASSLTNNAGEVSFRLNDAADSVKVIGNNGSLTVDLGGLPRGLTVTNLSSQGLTNGAFKVVVAKQGSGTPALIGGSVPFNSPRGVTVNQNPASPYFGWVYVANSAAGAKGDGLFGFSADLFDILGQGATAKTAGLNFATGTSSSPYRPKVGRDDDKVYVTDWSDGTGNLYRFMPDLSADPQGSYVLKPLEGSAAIPLVSDTANNNHGSVAAVEVLGTLAGGDMKIFTVDEDLQTDPTATGATEMNSLWRYDVNGGPLPWTNLPDAKLLTPAIAFTSQTMDLSYSPATGYFYVAQRRDNGGEPSVYVVDQDGNTLYNSRQASLDLGNTGDYLTALQGVTVSEDGKYLAAIANNNVVTIVPMVNGIPDLSTRFQYTGFGTTASARGIAFDRANNLYIVSSGLGFLQSVSLGFSATNTTSSDGTFTQEAPAIATTRVALELFDAGSGLNSVIAEGDTNVIATIRVSRSGGDNTNPMAVNFAVSGTAVRGTLTNGDYYLRVGGNMITNNSVTIPAGADQALIEVVANDDNVSEAIETINFALGNGPYTVNAQSTASVSIADNDPAAIEISRVVFNRMFEGNPFDILRFELQRLGDTNAGPFDVNIQYAGTATGGTDYTPVSTVTFNAGDVTKTFDVQVLPDTAIEGNETVIVSVAAGTGYSVGTNNVLTAGAQGVIVDDDQPAETVLFSDDFNTDDSANWTVLFGSINPASQDYTATFGFDYGAAGLGLPPAPHSNGDTLGLLVSVNKLDDLAEAAGVNLYPNGKDFSGNYALRFDMYLMQNASAGTTEHATFGINHDATHTNWFSNAAAGVPAGWTYDGIWAAVIADASDLGDYLLFSAPYAGSSPGPTTLAERSASTLEDVFHQPPWTPGGGAGSPGNTPSSATPSWAQVELRQENGVVTLSINATNILTVTNATGFTHGNIMLGYDDSFNSIGSGGGGLAIYDNVRVVSLGGTTTQPDVRISTITRTGNNVQINFTAGPNESPSAFKLVSSTNVAGPYTDDNTATITSLGGSNYQITTTASDAMRFYQIRRAP